MIIERQPWCDAKAVVFNCAYSQNSQIQKTNLRASAEFAGDFKTKRQCQAIDTASFVIVVYRLGVLTSVLCS